MTILYDQSGQSTTVFANLYTISHEDGNLGDAPVVGDATAFQIIYTGAAPAATTPAQLHNLVNTAFAKLIVITALNGGIDPYSGIDITGNGITYEQDIPDVGTIIRIVYDVGQCNGFGIATFDVNGNPITTPNPVILYHELSHALRGAQNALQPNDEIPATQDENDMRSHLGLCIRDVNNHDGGCGAGNTCGGSTGNGCFIVSAATGSAQSGEVMALRQLRDRVADLSELGARLIDEIYGEYYQFSPDIAAGLEQNEFARQIVLRTVVGPLLAWYSLAGVLALGRSDQATIDQAARDYLDACSGSLGGFSINALLEALRAGDAMPAGAPKSLTDLVPKIRRATQLPLVSWAILDPLVRASEPKTDQLSIIDDVAQWLATAPLEALAPPRNPQRLDQGLKGLAGFFNFEPKARRQIGDRLAKAWPEAVEALERHGFIQQSGA